jgi:hypothetical protein
VYEDLLGSLLGAGGSLAAGPREALLCTADEVTRKRRPFHWELEFPEVFFDAAGRHDPRGGFDAVLGNPPWDVLRADTGSRDERAAGQRDRGESLRFFRDAGVYRHQGGGHANRYQLFCERALQIARTGGRIGLILPSGLATDHGSAALRRALVAQAAVDRLVGFDNREAIFPIHRDVKFLLLTGTRGAPTDRIVGAFGRTRAEWLDELPDDTADDPPEARRITLSREAIERWDPEHLTIPLLSSAMDLAILAHARATVPPLADSWGARFGRELNATEDRPHFVARDERTARAPLPIVEGKHLEPFRVTLDAATRAIPAATAARLLDRAATFDRTRLAYRDVASATNRVTLIAALLPPGVVSVHTVFCLKTALPLTAQNCLLALLNSLVANYLVRLQVTTHVTAALMARLPVPRVEDPARRVLSALAREISEKGVDGAPEAFARVNTLAARAYGLTREQYTHIVSTFPLLSVGLRDACLRDYERGHRDTEDTEKTRR